MRQFDLLGDYPKPNQPRYVGDNIRTIKHRIIASYRDVRFFDGDRNRGYGGFKYDGRWIKVASKIIKEYNLNENSKILQLNCEKGFLLNDIKKLIPKIKIQGLESSEYAITKSMKSVIKDITKCDNYLNFEFNDRYFDFVIALGVVYTHNLTDAIKCLKEIQRVSKGKSFITLASYKTYEEYWLFKQWTVLGSTILQENEWIKVLQHVNYTGDYFFTNSNILNLKKK